MRQITVAECLPGTQVSPRQMVPIDLLLELIRVSNLEIQVLKLCNDMTFTQRFLYFYFSFIV